MLPWIAENWGIVMNLAQLALPWVLASTFAVAGGARAAELKPDDTLLLPELHGFVGQGYFVTTGNNYFDKSTFSNFGSFEMSEVGLNVTVQLTNRLRTGMQLFARDLGPIGDYRATLDWYYLDYKLKDWFGIRAGRVKLPFGLYNDSIDIDAARNSILPPQSLYPAADRDFLQAQTGVEVYGYHHLGGLGALDYRLYLGTVFIEPRQMSVVYNVSRLEIPYVAGGRVLWETPLDGLRLGGSLQALRLDSTLDVPLLATQFTVRVPAVFWVASAEYLMGDLLCAVEYSRWHLHSESSNISLLADMARVNERAYAKVSYQIAPWLQPGLSYSVFFPDMDHRAGRAAQQHDVSATLRFDILANWLVKLEAHYMVGTAALGPLLMSGPNPRSPDNDNRLLSELQPNWWLFLAKTTAHF